MLRYLNVIYSMDSSHTSYLLLNEAQFKHRVDSVSTLWFEELAIQKLPARDVENEQFLPS